jgi:hypothetical protein
MLAGRPVLGQGRNRHVLVRRADYLRAWTPKVGPEAAVIRWWSSIVLLVAYLSNFVWIPLVIAGLRADLPTMLAIGIVVAVVGFSLVLVSGALLYRANRRLTQIFGFRIGLGAVAPPPRTDAHYREWCSKHGVKPYSLGNE